MPSTVVTSQPPHCTSSVRQLFILTPSTSTVQVPQAPSLQPFLAPVRCASSRSQSSRVTRALAVAVTGSPLTVSDTERLRENPAAPTEVWGLDFAMAHLQPARAIGRSGQDR